MDTITISELSVIFNQPWYVYFIVLLVLMFIYGKKKDWEYEAKLFRPDSKDIIGRLQIKKYAKGLPAGELKLDFIKELYNKEFELVLNDTVIQKLLISENGQHCDILYPRYEDKKKQQIFRPRSTRRFNLMQLYFDDRVLPENNQTIEIRMNNDVLATGIMIRD